MMNSSDIVTWFFQLDAGILAGAALLITICLIGASAIVAIAELMIGESE
jgi:hypothetical protein